LPLIHVPSTERYELSDLVHLFQLAVMKVKEIETSNANGPSDSAPLCPQCGLMMVLRIHREGPRLGKRYYGCLNAPTCSGVVTVD